MYGHCKRKIRLNTEKLDYYLDSVKVVQCGRTKLDN